MKKKLLSLLLVATCLVDTTFAHAETTDGYDVDMQEVMQSEDTTYIDGVECNVDIDLDTGNVIVSGKTEDSEGVLTFEKNGGATLDIDNCGREDESYTLDVEELSTEDVDVELYDEDGDLVADYDDYDELVEDSYEGQVASSLVTITAYITAAVIISVATHYVLVEAGELYCAAKDFRKAVAKAEAATRKKCRQFYYPALLKTIQTGVKPMVMVYIIPHGINLNVAAARVKKDGSLYCLSELMAKQAINKAGYAAVNSYGSKNKFEQHTGYGWQFKHFHKGHATSTGAFKKKGSCHVMFGKPKKCEKK